MSLVNKDLINGKIYLEASGTLANRIDFAWEAYQSTSNKKEKREALKFLIYALDIRDPVNVNLQLIQLMAERGIHKDTNPEFIPGKSPSRIPFDPKIVIPEKKEVHSPEISAAIESKELLDVEHSSKELDKNKETIYLNTEKRAKHRVNISGGLFKKNGKPFDTRSMHSHDKEGFAAYTINSNGEISIFNHNRMRDKVAHSSMNAGAPVVAAGEIKIENGILKAITTHSGHYRPSLFNVARALEHFSWNNIDISQAKVITFNNPSKTLGHISSVATYYPAYEHFMYETPASQIYKQIDKLIDENVDSINAQVQSYQEKGIRSTLFHFKDKLTGSTLTQQRAELAAKFEREITLFQQNLKGSSYQNLPDKIIELEALINKYKQSNAHLSSTANKNESSGRLATAIESFKDKLSELKTLAEEKTEREEHTVSMKKIT